MLAIMQGVAHKNVGIFMYIYAPLPQWFVLLLRWWNWLKTDFYDFPMPVYDRKNICIKKLGILTTYTDRTRRISPRKI